MKILHLIADDNVEEPALRVLSALHMKTEQIAVIPETAPAAASLRHAGIDTISNPLRPLFRWRRKWALRRLVAREKPDVIHCWTRESVVLASGLKGPPVLGWVGGYDTPDTFETCAHLVAATRDIARHLVVQGADKGRVSFIPSFPDSAAMPPVDRATLSTPRDAKVLLCLSRLHPQKGIDTLLNALALLPDVLLWLGNDGPSRRALEQQAAKLDIGNRVRFLGRRTDRPALLRAADLCVMPSRVEPVGTVIVESWAAGTPVVACASQGPSALIEENVTGLLSPVGDAEKLAAALRHVLNDDALRRQLIAQGYAAYIKDYTREAVAHQWMRCYQSIYKL